MITVYIEHILNSISLCFEIVGVVIIVLSALYSLGYFLVYFKNRNNKPSVDVMRLELGRGIVLGLEYFLAADIIRTAITPDYYEIGLLSILVVIRTILNYFLNKDLDQLRALQNIRER